MSTLKLQILLGAVDRLTAPLRAVTGQSRITAKELADTKAKVRDLEKQSGQIDGYRTLGRQIGATRAQLTQAQQNAQRLARELAATANPTKAMTRELERAKAAVRTLSATEQQMVARHGALRTSLQQAGINTRQLGQHQRQLRTDLSAANAQLAQQRNRLAQVTDQQKRLARVKAGYDKTMALRNSVAGAGAVGAAAGAAGLYKINAIASAGLDFDAQMSKVQALTRLQKGSSELAMLRQQARDLGASTSFTAMDAAGGQGFLAMAGFTPQNIKAAMPGILNMAKAGGMEIARSADIASNILSGFRLPATEMGRVGDSLVATFTRSNTSLEMLGETMKYAAPVATGLGVDLETAAAMAGKLGDAGIQGSMAGTGIAGILTRLAKPPKEAAKALGKLGIETKDAAGNLRPIVDILEEIHRKTAKMGTGDQAAIFKGIAGQESLKSMINLVDQAGSGGLQKLIAELRQAKGEAAEVASVMADNARGDIDGLTSAWQDLNIEMMTSQNGPLRGLIQQVTEMTRGIGEWMRANPELTATIAKVAAITAVAAAAGGSLLLIVAGLLGPIAAVKMGFGMMTTMGAPLLTLLNGLSVGVVKLGVAMLTTPIGWIIMGIAAVAAGAYLLYKNWAGIKEWFVGIWEQCKPPLIAFWEFLKAAFAFSPLGLLTQNWSAIWAFFDTLPAGAANKGKAIIDGLIGGISAKWQNLKTKLAELTSFLPDWMKGGSPAKVTVQHATSTPAAQVKKERRFTGYYDNGGAIPAGKWGIAGERGPEIVEGPANVISRRRTAAITSAAMLASMPLAAMQPSQDATRTIREQVMPAELRQPADAVRTIREQVMPAELRQPADAVRTIREQVMPAALHQPADAVRTIREQVMPAALHQPADAIRTIREQVMPAELHQPADAIRTIREQVMPAALHQPADTATAPRIVATPQLATARGGSATTHINAPIHITQQPGQSAADVAQEVRRELDRRERQASARSRASLRDTN